MKNIEEKFRAAIRNEIKNIFEGKDDLPMDKMDSAEMEPFREDKVNEAPMDKRFENEWVKNSKVLLTHLMHELRKGPKGQTRAQLQLYAKQIAAALEVPAKMAKIVGMQETIDMDKVFMKGRKKKRTTDEAKINEGVGGVVTIKPIGAPLNEGNSYYDLKKQYYEISDNMGHGGLLSTLQDIKKKADTDEMDKIGGIDAEMKIWTAIHKLFNKSKLGKIL